MIHPNHRLPFLGWPVFWHADLDLDLDLESLEGIPECERLLAPKG